MRYNRVRAGSIGVEGPLIYGEGEEDGSPGPSLRGSPCASPLALEEENDGYVSMPGRKAAVPGISGRAELPRGGPAFGFSKIE